jgi:predicted DNA-binding protein
MKLRKKSMRRATIHLTERSVLAGCQVWPYHYTMVAVPKIKSTYALDQETVQRLEHLARRWGVSKSEVLRRAIRAAASESSEVATDAVSALDELQLPTGVLSEGASMGGTEPG